jgi:hypothetical protein
VRERLASLIDDTECPNRTISEWEVRALSSENADDELFAFINHELKK